MILHESCGYLLWNSVSGSSDMAACQQSQRVVPSGKVYRQIFDAEVHIFQVKLICLDLLLYKNVCYLLASGDVTVDCSASTKRWAKTKDYCQETYWMSCHQNLNCLLRTIASQKPNCLLRTVASQKPNCLLRTIASQKPNCLLRTIASQNPNCLLRIIASQNPNCLLRTIAS